MEKTRGEGPEQKDRTQRPTPKEGTDLSCRANLPCCSSRVCIMTEGPACPEQAV